MAAPPKPAEVGRTPRSAADALVGSSGLEAAEFVAEERVRGDPRGPGGPPHNFGRTGRFGKTKWHQAVSPAGIFLKTTGQTAYPTLLVVARILGNGPSRYYLGRGIE